MKLSASKAAKAVGVSIPTITRAIKSGRMTADPAEGGGWLIDTAELFRVFEAVKANTNVTPDGLGRETPDITPVLDLEVRMLREQLALMQRAMSDKDEVIADVRRDRDKWQEQAERAGRLLEGPKPLPVEASATISSGRPSWWPFRHRRAAP